MSGKAKIKQTKTGIRILRDDDFKRLFLQHDEFVAESDNFHQLVSETIEKVDMKAVIQEKECLSAPQPIRKKDILAQYPLPEAELDLHGCTVPQALAKLSLFIQHSIKRELRTVKIIVGKGIHSDTKAILPDIAEQQMIALKQQNILLSFHWEKHKKRKSGALIAYFNTVAFQLE